MKRAKLDVRALLAAALLGSFACSGDDGGGRPPANGVQTTPLTCTANTPRACPCVGQGMGTQLCNATGNGYGACTGCPPAPLPPGAGTSGAAGSTPNATAGSGGSAAGAGAAGRAGTGPGTSGSGGASVPDGGVDGGDHEPTPSAGAVRGISCGVGLPTLCELGKEKCCVRSLATDTCVEASATCDCDVQNCTSMEALCDGPEDCESGQVCCGTLSQNGNGYDRFVCAAQCQSTGQQRVACHEGETMCPTGLICANSQLLTNVQICIDPATIEQ
jgi:hypothetical protein